MVTRTSFDAADPVTRRGFVAGAAKALLGVAALPALPAWRHAGASGIPRRAAARASRVIYLFMRGGMSQLDTLDPKPGASTQGPVKAIGTNVAGIQLSEHFPNLAKLCDRVTILNALTSTQGAHQQGQYLLRTSYELRGTIQHPSLGAWVQCLAGRLNPMLPGHVILGGGSDLPGAGFLPPEFLPLPIGEPESGLQHSARPAGVKEEVFERRLAKLRQMNAEFAGRYHGQQVQAYTDTYEEAVRLMRSADLVAFDISDEPASVKSAYGSSSFGQGCLLARRLIEHDVRFVEVVNDGWDTHNQNFDTLAEKGPELDRGLSALLVDLEARGLLEDTLVVLATEFGRTPDITAGNDGRNHYPKAFSALLAGGGVNGGRKWGKTDAEGREIVEGRMTLTDFNATLAYALGLPLEHEIRSPMGRPFKVADKGKPVLELFA